MPVSNSNAALIANPTLNAHPYRYSSFDGDRNINRFAQQFRYYLRWVRMNGQFLEIRGHAPSPTEVRAFFFDHQTTSPTPQPVPPQEYEFAPPSTAPGPTQQLALKEIVARFDTSLFTQDVLSRQFNQIRFQKRALKWAVISLLESALINGDSAANPGEFDGLNRLVDRGLGQRLAAAPSDGLDVLNEAMTMVRSHNRRVNLIVMNQDAWRRVLSLLRDNGVRPGFKYRRRLRQRVLYFDGVPVCLSDHVPTNAPDRSTSVYFLSLGRPNGVFGLTSRKRPRLYFKRTRRDDSPFYTYSAHFRCALASATSDALVELTGWRVG